MYGSDVERLKKVVVAEVDAHREELIELSLRIHSNPELGFEEYKAAGWLAESLEKNGYSVERGFCELPTAFVAGYGRGSPAIAILAEYDALPKLGHACGHNIIATSALGAGIASRIAVDELGGRVMVIGTPGEEIYGGKAIMVGRGGFSDVDAAMMVHPGVRNTVIAQALACISLEVEFFGRPAHAASHPYKGVNALEAMILSFNGVDALRQHIKDRARIHGIITDGGEAANIVPAHSAGRFLVRAEDETYLDELKGRVLNCFMAASMATGARLEHRWGEVCYAPMLNNLALAEVFARNMESLGRKIEPPDPEEGFGSTDMGNVSLVVPGIHPTVAIAGREVLAHSPEFAAAAASEAGHHGLIDGAKAMAMSVVDLLGDSEAMVRIKDEFFARGGNCSG